jgi:hypothetical protein
MSQEPPASPPPPPGSKPPGSTGPTPPGPSGPSGPSGPGGRATPPPPPPSGRGGQRDPRQDWAAGGAVFAGTLLLISGVLAVLEGIVGIARDSVYVSSRNYTYEFSTTSWGWIHLVLGVIAILVGYGLLHGDSWARYAGIGLAGLSLIANFMFLPYQPVWSVIMIGIDLYVIWALAVYHPLNAGRAGHTGPGGHAGGTL